MLDALESAGGVADHAVLVAASSRGALARALRDGLVTRVGRGVYALPGLAEDTATQARSRAWAWWHEGPNEDEQRVLAARLARAQGAHAALSHLCAAAHHGWPVLHDPETLDICVPRRRRVERRSGIRVHRADLHADELRDHVTTPVRTVLDCARDLPLAEAVVVADSALRLGAVGPGELREAAAARRHGCERIRRVVEVADGRAANPFESALRVAVLDVPGLRVVPQVEITDSGFFARVDLADVRLRLVLEADSYEFHGSAAAFAKDRRRYVQLTVLGWTVLPFGFSDVVDRPEWVASMVAGAVIGLSPRRSLAA